MPEHDGVIKFKQTFTQKEPYPFSQLKELNAWRTVIYSPHLIGQDPLRYGGAGYGNVSQRISPFDASKNKRRFIITGTQTGGLQELTEHHYTLVSSYHPEKNEVFAEGPILASSEAMTHGALYDLDASLRFVFHAHSPQIWRCARDLELPMTALHIEYGTPEMVGEVQRLFMDTNVQDMKIFAMGGHEDGVMTFGKTAEEAGMLLIRYLVKALQMA